MNIQILTVSSKGQISLPAAEEFEASLDVAKKWAESVGFEENDVNEIIKSVRQRKKK